MQKEKITYSYIFFQIKFSDKRVFETPIFCSCFHGLHNILSQGILNVKKKKHNLLKHLSFERLLLTLKS